LRWEIAAKSASAKPIVYDIVFRNALGSKFDELELPIWNEGGKEIKGIAKALGLPSQTAKEISETYGVITKILFGPELELKSVEVSEERVRGRTLECPMLNRAREMGLEPAKLLDACKTFGRSAIENLNPKYTQRLGKRMCLGDPYCETVVERR